PELLRPSQRDLKRIGALRRPLPKACLGLPALVPSTPGDTERAERPGARRRGDRVPGGPGGVHARAERDQIRQLGDRLDVAERGQPREPLRVEEISAEQAEVVIGKVEQAAPPVVKEVALEDAFHEQRILAWLAPGP